MPQVCTVCRHPQRATIEDALLRNTPLRKIAERTRTSATALHRHKKHLPAKLAQVAAETAQSIAEATSLLSRVENLMRRSEVIAEEAKRARQWAAATAALREARGCLELLGKLRGELQSGTSVKVGVMVQAPSPAMDESVDLELAIAREISRLTDHFDDDVIRVLKARLQSADLAALSAGGVPQSPESGTA